MLCLKNKSSSLDTLFNEISTWDNPNKKKLLQQVNQEGDNVLVIAAEKGPEKLEQVFKLINQLNNPKQELWSLLKNHSTKILNASKKSPQIIPTLLKYCSKLDTADQQTFYQTRTENLLCMIGLCELKMQELLDELAAKETEFEMRVEKSKLPLLANLDPNATPNQKAHFSIHSIHKTLKSSLDTYQSSNKEPADAHTLKNSWDATLNDKQLSPILKENRASVGKIIGKLLLALSIIGLGYFIYEKIQKNKKGQGFFETNSAHLLKKLSGQVEQLDKTREQEDPNKSFPLA